MTKKAIRISIDGSNSDVAESEQAIMKEVSNLPGRVPASIRIVPYQPDNPEILKMESAKMLKWLAGDETKNGNPLSEDPEPQEVQDEKFWHQVKRLGGPAAKRFAAQIMWGTEEARRREEKNNGSKKAEASSVTGS
jgi:hypothetical protein